MNEHSQNNADFLSDDLWEKIKNILPGREGKPGAKGKDNRLFLEAVIWILRTENPWRALPEEKYGKWFTVYTRYNRWNKEGVWTKLVETMENAGCYDFICEEAGLKLRSGARPEHIKPQKVVQIDRPQPTMVKEVESKNLPGMIKSFFRDVIGNNLTAPQSQISPNKQHTSNDYPENNPIITNKGLIIQDYDHFYKENNFNRTNLNKPSESDEQIDARLRERFDALRDITSRCIHGDFRSLIVSGAPGLGKTFEIEKQLKAYSPDGQLYSIVRGHAKASGLYPILYKYKNQNDIIVIDDADGIFDDAVSLNILKAATDSIDTRTISWLSRTRLTEFDDEGNTLPRQFEYRGIIIFITNLDFDDMIRRGHKLAPHFAALTSRSFYVDLTIRTPRDCLIRIRQVIKDGLQDPNGILTGLSAPEQKEVIEFIENNYSSMREISLRAVKKLVNLRKGGGNWEAQAKFAMFR